MVAILAGLMIFPAAFSVGVNPDSGPSLIFITLPNVFAQAFASWPIVGYAISLLFFVLLTLAALTSLMSLHEVSTAFLHEELVITRKKAALMVTITATIIGALCSLSLGAVDVMVVFGKSLFDWFSQDSSQRVHQLGNAPRPFLPSLSFPCEIHLSIGNLVHLLTSVWLIKITYEQS